MTLKSQVALEDPKRYRIELSYSRGADLSPLEVNHMQQKNIHFAFCSFVITISAALLYKIEIPHICYPKRKMILKSHSTSMHVVCCFIEVEALPESM